MGEDKSNEIRIWGLFGAPWAAAFAVWFLFFPNLVPQFAWDIQPRLAQVFIGAGYIFRTAFFLSIAIWPSWNRVRWMFWGNLAFTGTLLLATFWHAEEFRWGSVIGHAWLLLYVAEPLAMIYLAIGQSFRSEGPSTGGPLHRGFVRFLMIESGILFIFAALLIINPEFAGLRWPWELNPLDARMAAAWMAGWSVWTASMAFARDWHAVRVGAALNILNGVALFVASVMSYGEFTSPRTNGYIIFLAAFTGLMAFFFWRQERAVPRTLVQAG